MFHIKKLSLGNYRCFQKLNIDFENDVTVIFAENAGGKTAILNALAVMLGKLQPKEYGGKKLNIQQDARRVRDKEGHWQTEGVCKLACWAALGNQDDVMWWIKRSPTSAYDILGIEDITEAIEQARQPDNRWPVIAYYGTSRLMGLSDSGPKANWGIKAQIETRELPGRMNGYEECLNSSISDEILIKWLRTETFGDLAKKERGEPERGIRHAVIKTMKRAVPNVSDLWFDPTIDKLKARFEWGDELSWDELSDGFHILLGLVGDIARRAVILNEQDGLDAPELAEGIILIDEVDLHLHPKWQRKVIDGLKRAFPKMQWIVTTHSPQVLSSVENRQVRMLLNRALDKREVLVDGRDSNAILREWMDTDERDNRGVNALRKLHEAIDAGHLQEAEQQLAELRERWGGIDPSLVYANKLLEWERRDAEAQKGKSSTKTKRGKKRAKD